MSKKSVRSIFISDIHLGCKHTKCDSLLNFLEQYKTKKLYLVGDIIDGWRLKRNFYWDKNHTLVLQKLIKKMKKGVEVFYLTGNHDEFLRDFSDLQLDNLTITNEMIHESPNEDLYLVIHGDIFDAVTKHYRFLYYFGDIGYSLVLEINKWVNILRRKLGLKYWSFSKLCKNNIKQAVNFINSFEKFVVKYTKQKNCTGVICGHIHNPVIKNIDGIQYINCGDWIENKSAIIEYDDGTIELKEFE
jgi:UDP-2,3-diacylglucosamine pyrophosphatase LpxH